MVVIFHLMILHVKLARTIARVSRECGVQRLIHFSALNASPTPPAIIFRKPSRFLQSKVKFRKEFLTQKFVCLF